MTPAINLSSVTKTPVIIKLATSLHLKVNIRGRAPPSPPAWANFSIMTKCTPKRGRCHSLWTLWLCLTKAVDELGLFLALPVKIWQKLGNGFIWPLTWPLLSYAADISVSYSRND
jgi:hypothetical protein